MKTLLDQYKEDRFKIVVYDNKLLLEELHYFETIEEFIGVIIQNEFTYLASWDLEGNLISNFGTFDCEQGKLIIY